jgi:wyosine [tRNA(Phe)-imidazoG37] synthetase (radical SAM superfamily)
MAGFLFDQIVFGPISSRRLGRSLGVNLLPLNKKSCSFDCIYCECGWTLPKAHGTPLEYPEAGLVAQALEHTLKQMAESGEPMPAAITFAGNGEPTLHRQFHLVVDSTIALRNRYAPKALITVLSNGTTLHREEVFNALLRVDQNIQKLDGGTNETIHLINRPRNPAFNLEDLTKNLCRFNGKVIIQSLFLKGMMGNTPVDNTTQKEIDAWIEHLLRINPEYVMIYPIDRATPASNLVKLDVPALHQIALQADKAGISTRVYP